MSASEGPNKAWFASQKWANLALEVRYMQERLDRSLFLSGVREWSAVPGDKLGDSPEASVVRVHACAALGALGHLATSLENLATKIDEQAG